MAIRLNLPVDKMRLRIQSLIPTLILLLSTPHSYAQESLSSIMARMSSASAIRIRYQETRHLQLLNKPWQGSGYFYINPDGIMVREQIKPQRELMAVQQGQMFYFNPTQNRHYQARIDASKPLGFQVTSFQALINGNLTRLQSLHQISLQTTPENWSINLIPKQNLNDDSLAKIQVSGGIGQAARIIKLYQADGDSSETLLSEDIRDNDWQQQIDRLLSEIKK